MSRSNHVLQVVVVVGLLLEWCGEERRGIGGSQQFERLMWEIVVVQLARLSCVLDSQRHLSEVRSTI